VLTTGLAVLVGLVVGLSLPVRRNHYARLRPRGLGVFAVGVVAQIVASHVTGRPGFTLLLLAYAALIVFALLNVHIPGAFVLAFGLAMNLAVIAVNVGMPVHPRALVDAGVIRADELPTVSLNGHRHFEGRDDELTFLDDRIPLPIASQALSFGDLVLAFGAADVVAHIVRRRRGQVHVPQHMIDLREPRATRTRPAAEPVISVREAEEERLLEDVNA